MRHSFSLRKNTSDIPTFYKVFFYNEYDIDVFKKPKVIVDGGSNIGLFAIKMKNEYPDSKVICIEPDLENFNLTKKNLSSYNNVFVENCGLWNKDAKLKVYDKFNLGKWGMVVEEVSNEGDVSAICLKSLLQKYSIDYIDVLKLDIETSEKILFSKNYEEWLPRVKTIIIELHDWVEEGCAKPFFEAINKSFKKYSYLVKGENTIIANNDLA
ncbi:MAG TPA: FkbM family methyltransferase [Parafilimonas sp.]|nr:FkbM family methyltransferase [Parafilimonas sp.]